MSDVPHLRFPEFSGEWECSTIGREFELYSGNTPSRLDKEQFNGNVNWISSGELKEHYIYDTKEKITEEAASCNNLRLLPIGTFVIAIYGLEAEGVRGTGSVIQKKSTISQACMAFSSKGTITNEFLYSWYKKHGNLIGLKYAQGTKQQNLSYDIISQFRISYPSITEQKKLQDFISLIDERIATQNKIIEDLRLLRDAISVCLLSPKSDWKCYKVSEIADIGRGRVISSKEIANQNNPQYPVYSSQTSNEGVMGYLDNYAFDGEYITWTTDGANAGTVFYRNGRFNCTNVCGTLKLHYQFDAYYCSLVLANATKKYVSVNLANPKLMNNTMAAIKLYLPPFQEQKRMAQLFRKMDENITLEHKLLLSYQKQKHYLLQQMFI